MLIRNTVVLDWRFFQGFMCIRWKRAKTKLKLSLTLNEIRIRLIDRKSVELIKICDSKNGIIQLFFNLFLEFSWVNFSKPGGLDSRDQLLKTVENVHHVEINFFFIGQDLKNRDFSIETWLGQDFCQDCQDFWYFWDLSRLFEIYQDFLRFIEISPHYRDPQA